jgi:hypothetical protein
MNRGACAVPLIVSSLRENIRIFVENAAINAALKHPYPRHTTTRRCQTSRQSTMMIVFPLGIIQSFVTMSSTPEIYPSLAFS